MVSIRREKQSVLLEIVAESVQNAPRNLREASYGNIEVKIALYSRIGMIGHVVNTETSN